MILLPVYLININILYIMLVGRRDLIKLLIKDNMIHLIPYSIRRNIESEVIDINLENEVLSIKHRYVLYKNSHYTTFNKKEIDIRISVEIEGNDTGANYYLTMDIEFDFEAVTKLSLLDTLINELWDIFYLYYRVVAPMISSNNPTYYPFASFSPVNIQQTFTRRFTNITNLEIADKLKILKPKYDGVRAKIAYIPHMDNTVLIDYYNNPEKLYVFSDNNTISFGNVKDLPFLENIPNIVVLCEEMPHVDADDKIPNIIITDICGGYVNKTFHLMLPEDAYTLIQTFNLKPLTKIPKQLITAEKYTDARPNDGFIYTTLKNKGLFRILGQKAVLTTFNINDINKYLQIEHVHPMKIDGYLLISATQEAKIKIPTIDVYVKDEQIIIDNIIYKVQNTKGNGIYEVTLKDNHYVILRKRYDRENPSSDEEVQEFLKLLQYFS